MRDGNSDDHGEPKCCCTAGRAGRRGPAGTGAVERHARCRHDGMRSRRSSMISVAIIGPDGAGKSTITQLLEREPMPAPVKRIYMGVNLEASSLMLPTTRLALAVKSARGRRSDMVGPGQVASRPTGGPARRAVKAGGRGVRLLMWLAEGWFRPAVAQIHRRRGAIVVFDRHFVA